jgi:hypothetical protein
MSNELQQRLDAIARIVEGVDSRAVAGDGPITDFGDEVTTQEARYIYVLASGVPRAELRRALKLWAPTGSMRRESIPVKKAKRKAK